jgi:HK97 family phage portal protein
MAVVQSLGALIAQETAWSPSYSYGSLGMYDSYHYDYATLYKTQPNIRTCVDFLSRNIAQLGLHVFQRKGETDRVRLRDHPLAKLIEQPLPPEMKVTRYHLIESLMADLGIYFNAYWLKVGSPPQALLRVPPPWVTVYGSVVPMRYEVSMPDKPRTFQPTEIVHFRGYNPLDPVSGLSPLETLRRVLAEEHAAGDYREHFWANSARMNGVIQRPAEAPQWSTDARARFKAEFEALYSGGENSGKTAILEEGMSWKESSFNAQESEYLAGRKLTREECARAYHIPLPMVGILDNATFSNIREQHKNLYQDSLGPWLSMIEGDIELQLLPDLSAAPGIYVEFNIAEKLQGSFEEQVQSLQSSVGAPWLTRDEARARMNLPSMGGDAAKLVVPLNVLIGGQASPRDSAPPPKALGAGTKARREGQIDPSQPGLRERHEIKWTQVMAHHFKRQQDTIIGKVPEKARKADIGDLWDEERWDDELHDDIYRLNVATATVWAKHLTEQLDIDLDADRMLPWLEENARIAAEEINATTRDGLITALKDDAPRAAALALFALAIDVRAPEIAASKVTTASTFGSFEGAKQANLKTKTWQTNSANPREAHAALDGETVALDERFSNGQLWPGDPAGGAENNANCKCSVTFGRE